MLDISNAAPVPRLVQTINLPTMHRIASRRRRMCWIQLWRGKNRNVALPVRAASTPRACPSCSSLRRTRLGFDVAISCSIRFVLPRGELVVATRVPEFNRQRVAGYLCGCGRLIIQTKRQSVSTIKPTTAAYALTAREVDAVKWLMGESL